MVAYYRHSGRSTPMGLPLTVVGGTAAAAMLGVVYTYLTVWIPFIYVLFLVTIGFGFSLGWVTFFLAKAGKVRSTGATALAGLFVGLVGLFVAWAVDMPARLGRAGVEGVDFTLHPSAVLSYIGQLLETGSWTIGPWQPTGFFLGVVWLIEAGIIVFFAMGIPGSSMGSSMFCEACDTWGEKENVPHRLSADRAEELVGRLQAGDFAVLSRTPRAGMEAAAYLKLRLHRCAGCTDSNYLTLLGVTKTKDEKGKESESENEILELLKVPSAAVEEIRRAGREVDPKAAPDAGEAGQPASAGTQDGSIGADDEHATASFPIVSFLGSIFIAITLMVLVARGVPGWDVNPYAIDWTTFSPPGGGFSVEFPGTPTLTTEKMEAEGQAPQATIFLYQTGVAHKGVYAVGYLEFKEEELPTDDSAGLLSRIAEDFFQGMEGKLVKKEDSELNGHPGWTAMYRGEEDATTKACAYITKSRVYLLFLVQPTEGFDEAMASRVLDSFALKDGQK